LLAGNHTFFANDDTHALFRKKPGRRESDDAGTDDDDIG
jgi:hypothetical protein